LLQLGSQFDLGLSEATYEEIIRKKTAHLMSSCCELGAMMGGVPGTLASDLADFGLRFGMAFQIVDDCLDLVGSEEELGKAAGSDLRQGKLTLPVILLLSSASEDDRERLMRLIHEGTPDEMLGCVRAEVIRTGALAAAYTKAEQYAASAKSALGNLRNPEIRSHLECLADYVIRRRT
jgi:octaprenyl-diphosphate synthase